MTHRSHSIGGEHGYVIKHLNDQETEMGLIYERSIGQRKLVMREQRAALVFARGACRIEVSIKASRHKHDLTSTQLLYLPPDLEVSMVGRSAVFDLLILMPSPTYSKALVADNQLAAEEADALAKQVFLLRRSRWMDDLIERYFFERILNHSTPPGCPFFLEKQMLNELARLIFVGKIPTTGNLLGEEPSNLALKALNYLEINLLKKIDLNALCKHTKSTQPTLTRTFRKHFGKTPGAYLKERRLDEAANMIERDDYRIGDICMLIGYEDLGSFSRAFKERFGVPPQKYRDRSKKFAR